MTSDQRNGRPILPKERLKHGAYYRGRGMNTTVARWNGVENVFYHWRNKSGWIFIATLPHPGDGQPPFDVFRVVEEMDKPPFVIPFDRHAENEQFNGDPEDIEDPE